MFKYRAISFPLLLALLAAIIFWRDGGPVLFLFTASTAFGLVLYETETMLKTIGVPNRTVSTAIAGGIFFFGLLSITEYTRIEWVANSALIVLTFSGLYLIYSGWLAVLFGGERKEVLLGTITSLGIMTGLFFPMISLATIYFDHVFWFLFVALVTKMMDTGGYIFGMLSARWMKNGNHKILPKISPKKSWEGTFGGLLFSMTAAYLFWLFRPEELYFPVWWALSTGFVLGIGSFAGDLTESALKRTCGVKDSGHWIPGMGGAFDVLDSFIYNGVLFWLMCAIR